MNGTMIVSVSKDMMVATAYVVQNDSLLTVESAIKSLNDMGIAGGILKENLVAMIEGGQYEKTYEVARGREPGVSIPGHFQFFVEVATKRDGPIVNEDGSVDFGKKRALIRAGEKIAEYHHAKSGTFGYTVYSSVIAPKPAKELTMVCGEGAVREEDNIFATVDGEVIFDGDKLSVKNSLVINGNAKFGTDTKTEFTGDVRVTGDVLTGVSIVADGSIEVDGIVEGCTLRAGKDIIIKGGIHGQEIAVIDALGSIYCPFIEEAKVTAGHEVHVDSLLNTEVNAGESVYVQGARANIIGGRVTATKEIIADYIGNTAEVKTQLNILNYDKFTVRTSKIVVNKMIFPATEICVNGISYKGRATRNGEFHLIDDIVRLYNIGEYSELVIKAPVEEKKTVMLIDDEPMILKTFYTYLNSKYQIMIAASPDDALAQLNNRVPDLILLDYKMPVMDGGEFLTTIRKTTWKAYCNVPVIFVTAMTDKDIITKILKLYPQGYLLKPLTKEELNDVVDKFFEDEKTANELKALGL